MDTLTVTVAEAAKITGLCRATIYRAIDGGRLKAKSVGRRRLVNAQSLREYVGADAA